MAQADTSALFSLAGKTALVTGGSRGIGRMIAEGLVRAGARVLISSRKKGACEHVANELSALGPCESVPADVADPGGRASLEQGGLQK